MLLGGHSVAQEREGSGPVLVSFTVCHSEKKKET
jgi:hypothetical protein